MAIGILALTVLTVTILSVRQLAFIRQTSKISAREQLARSTIASIEADQEALRSRTKMLEPVTIDGVIYQRQVSIREVEERLSELQLSLAGDGRTSLYTKKVITP